VNGTSYLYSYQRFSKQSSDSLSVSPKDTPSARFCPLGCCKVNVEARIPSALLGTFDVGGRSSPYLETIGQCGGICISDRHPTVTKRLSCPALSTAARLSALGTIFE
jgi:hypothetical protein